MLVGGFMSPEDAVDKFRKLIKEKWLNWKSLEFSLRSLYVFGILLFIAAFIFLLISINEAASLRFEFSTLGVSMLTQIFEAPIKSFGALLGIVTLYAALKRMKANDEQVKIANKQIELVSEQNRISNYFKFRDEFIAHFKKHSYTCRFIRKFVDKNFVEETLLFHAYEIIFGTITSFTAKMQLEMKRQLQEYLTHAERNFLNQGLISIEASNLNSVREAINHLYETKIELMGDISPILVESSRHKIDLLYFSHNDQEVEIYLRALYTYYDLEFLSDLKSFIGESYLDTTIIAANIGRYFEFLGGESPLGLVNNNENQ